jgi:hypothetical protein
MRRDDPERDQVSALRCPCRLAERLGEGRLVGDEVVSRHDDADLVALAPREGRRQRRRGRRGASQRLPEDVVLRQVGQLIAGGTDVGLARDDMDVLGPKERAEPRDRLLEQARVAGERQQLLRRAAPRQWPEPRAGAAGHDDRVHQRPVTSRSTSASSRSPSSSVRR